SLVPPAWVASAVQDVCFYLFSISAVLAGGVVDVSDRAARLLGITYGNLAQIQQIANLVADGLTPLNLQTVANFMHVYDPIAADWNRLREGAAIGQALVDVSDRAARLLGIVYGNLAQLQQIAALNDALPAPANLVSVAGFNLVFNGVTWERLRSGTVLGSMLSDPLDRWGRQLGLIDLSRYLGAACGPLNPIDTQDTGLNTNPRRFESDNGFRSPVVARAGGVATALWTIATLPARTVGQVTTIYTLTIENSTGAAITGWLEIAGVAITIPYHVADNDSIVIPYPAGLNSGDF
ncbi:unnamed protein product, partial [marine sediment metagenome]